MSFRVTESGISDFRFLKYRIRIHDKIRIFPITSPNATRCCCISVLLLVLLYRNRYPFSAIFVRRSGSDERGRGAVGARGRAAGGAVVRRVQTGRAAVAVGLRVRAARRRERRRERRRGRAGERDHGRPGQASVAGTGAGHGRGHGGGAAATGPGGQMVLPA